LPTCVSICRISGFKSVLLAQDLMIVIFKIHLEISKLVLDINQLLHNLRRLLLVLEIVRALIFQHSIVLLESLRRVGFMRHRNVFGRRRFLIDA